MLTALLADSYCSQVERCTRGSEHAANCHEEVPIIRILTAVHAICEFAGTQAPGELVQAHVPGLTANRPHAWHDGGHAT